MPIAIERKSTETVYSNNGYINDHDYLRVRFQVCGGANVSGIAPYSEDASDTTTAAASFGGCGGRRKLVADVENSSSTSSIGKNNDDEFMREGEQVQSNLKGGGLNNLEDLEEVLPMKRHISQLYGGKSKSFTNLGDAEGCLSIREIMKTENAYRRKRKKLAFISLLTEKESLLCP